MCPLYPFARSPSAQCMYPYAAAQPAPPPEKSQNRPKDTPGYDYSITIPEQSRLLGRCHDGVAQRLAPPPGAGSLRWGRDDKTVDPEGEVEDDQEGYGQPHGQCQRYLWVGRMRVSDDPVN